MEHANTTTAIDLLCDRVGLHPVEQRDERTWVLDWDNADLKRRKVLVTDVTDKMTGYVTKIMLAEKPFDPRNDERAFLSLSRDGQWLLAAERNSKRRKADAYDLSLLGPRQRTGSGYQFQRVAVRTGTQDAASWLFQREPIGVRS